MNGTTLLTRLGAGLTRLGAGIALAAVGTAAVAVGAAGSGAAGSGAAGSGAAGSGAAGFGVGAAYAGPSTLPHHCSASSDGPVYTAGCWGGSGSFRAALTCAAPDGTTHLAYGPWRATAASAALITPSIGSCDVADTIATAVVERSAGLVGEQL
jgi:serine protease Do